MTKPTILTGLRANNDLHIGNYFGALLPIVNMARERAGDYTVNLFIPDLHSFTTPINHDELYGQSLHNARLFLAAGLPAAAEDIHMYRQSYVTAHSELTWILDCFTGFGEMSRMTQFKDKSSKLSEDRISVGLFNYPVLMAADILLYDAEYVPVGDDQSQHLEFTRDIAERMNSRFGELFTVPKSVKEQHQFFGKDQGLRIRNLIVPTQKMGKSDDEQRGVIYLSEDPAIAAKKIMGATTDSLAEINFDWERQPGVTNLLQILSLTSNMPQEEVNRQWIGKQQYGELKKAVATSVQSMLEDFQQRLQAIDEAAVLRKLEADEAKVALTAQATLLRAQKAVGLRR
ncbi:tryptophan--tRNA ligase [Candidatus Saccharibacteria bacterium]|nr:tryptophan--tRNA ligase [Candidatus Saccharibacteria bacterium]